MSFVIRPESPNDAGAVRAVHRLAFGRDDEARLVDELRAGGHVRLAFVAEETGRVAGHVAFSDLRIEAADGTVPALALAPLAVLPACQGRGIGSGLVREGLGQCRVQGHRIVIVVGDPGYYARFGFDAMRAATLTSPYAGPAFLALELEPGALEGVSGTVVYAPPFAAF